MPSARANITPASKVGFLRYGDGFDQLLVIELPKSAASRRGSAGRRREYRAA